MKRLSLHHLTALDATPAELATIAGRLECQHITLFTHVPEQARAMFPCVMPDDVQALSDALASANVSVCKLAVFPLDQDGGLGRFAAGLKPGAALGAPCATGQLSKIERTAPAARALLALEDVAGENGFK